MNDEELDAPVRAHFDAAARRHPAPDFEAVFGAAEARARAPRTHRWRIAVAGALAASLAAVVVFEMRPPHESGDELLIAELSATTRWTAPSDRWPTTQSIDYLGLPRFEDMTVQPQEVKTWF
jgi:hypothetical protein